MLAREQGVDLDAGFRGYFLKATAFDFVGDEDLALVARQFVDRQFQLVDEDPPQVERFGAVVGRREEIFESQEIALLILDRGVAERLRTLLAKQIRDAVAGDLKEPAG